MADLLERVRRTGLLEPGRPVVVLLSGGRDSVCLLDCAVRLSGVRSVRALHVNYGLRAEAGEDEALCRALCDRHGVRLDVLRVAPPEGSGNLQAWARGVRLGAAVRTAAGLGGDVATGHTATDQAETVLYRLAASPGRRALLGMAARDGRLVRPLLGVTRAQTADHCVVRGLPFADDASNADERFARNRARGELVPALRRLHPAAEANVVRTAQLLRDEAEVLDGVVDTVLDGRDHLSVAHLGALPRALARLVLRRLAEQAVGGLCSRVPGRLDDVLALGDDGALDVGDGARVVVEAGILHVEASRGRAAPQRAG